MKILSFLLLNMLSCLTISAQEVKHTLYKGTINNKQVTLYMKQEPNPCGGTGLLYQGIYHYGTSNDWIQLSIDENQKGNFCMTEFGFTGVLIVKKTADGINGIWISPDGKTQLKVILKKQFLSAKEKAEMEEKMERTNYENNDC